MSHTDKTDPPWVHAQQRWEIRHHPSCRLNTARWRHECDAPKAPPKHTAGMYSHATRCSWVADIPSYYSRRGSKIYGLENHVHEDANLCERGIRARWRTTRAVLLATSIEDIDDVELPDPRHRHVALWDRW